MLDEAVWSQADTSTGTWIQVTPAPGMPATEPTSVRILYDEGSLYIGARLYDSDTGHLYVPGLEPDFDTPSSDLFGIAFDSHHDGQSGFVFAVNPAGALYDAQTFNDGRDVLPAWEGIADIRTSVRSGASTSSGEFAATTRTQCGLRCLCSTGSINSRCPEP